jgi:putative colanic acid biosynthesis UDP-glucose lipid carrier transferase
MLIIAVAVKQSSPGPIIFSQLRFGKHRRLIRVYKFRTMFHDTNRRYRSATSNDPRVTGVGKILRATSLDELPQLFNVLNGTMSIVGPRPHPVMLDVKYEKQFPWIRQRYRVRPGITGASQVLGFRGHIDGAEHMRWRLDKDIEYTQEYSLRGDINIMLKTIGAVLKRTNAY